MLTKGEFNTHGHELRTSSYIKKKKSLKSSNSKLDLKFTYKSIKI